MGSAAQAAASVARVAQSASDLSSQKILSAKSRGPMLVELHRFQFSISFVASSHIANMWVYSYSGIPFYSGQLSRVELMHSVQLSSECECPLNSVLSIHSYILPG